MYSTQTNKGTFVMVHILRITTAVAMLAFAATGIAVYSPGLQIKGYGCIAHPDYGLYIPHFC